MRCPFCLSSSTRVLDSRLADGGDSVRRRRECNGCHMRFWTFERYDVSQLCVLKKDGRREPFEHRKLFKSVQSACKKLSVADSEIEKMVSGLVSELSSRPGASGEISSDDIAAGVLKGLLNINEVACLRFASFYDLREGKGPFKDNPMLFFKLFQRFFKEE